MKCHKRTPLGVSRIQRVAVLKFENFFPAKKVKTKNADPDQTASKEEV